MIIDDSVYGTIELGHFAEKIIQTQPLQRLKNIHQNGAMFLAYSHISTSRFEHSLGVYHLIKTLNGSQKEQIAGLLHDLPHTAFSHVIDYVLENEGENFHERHKLRFLLDLELSTVLRQHGLEPEEFIEDDKFSLLEAKLPALCADRIDYTLRDSIAWRRISQLEAKEFVSSLRVVNGAIAIESVYWGQWFQDLYQYLNQNIFRDSKNIIVNLEFTKLLKRALKMSVIEIEDFFQDDRFILNKINDCEILKADLEKINTELNNNDSELPYIDFKNRYVDPLVIENGKVELLSKYAS